MSITANDENSLDSLNVQGDFNGPDGRIHKDIQFARHYDKKGMFAHYRPRTTTARDLGFTDHDLERALKFGHTVAINVEQHSTTIILGRHAQLTDANGKIQTFFVDKAGRIVIGVRSMIPKHFSSKDGKGSAQLHSELGTWINVTVEAGATQMTLRAGKGATSKAIIWTRVEYVRGELAMERPNWGLVA